MLRRLQLLGHRDRRSNNPATQPGAAKSCGAN